MIEVITNPKLSSLRLEQIMKIQFRNSIIPVEDLVAVGEITLLMELRDRHAKVEYVAVPALSNASTAISNILFIQHKG